MKYTTIPKGYRLTVTSWENDADNYRTKTMDGLSERETHFLVDLISLLGSRHGRGDTENFGNMYEPSDVELAAFTSAVQSVVAKHDLEDSRLINHFETLVDPESVQDAVDAILFDLGLTGSSDYYTRVMDSYKVEHLPKAIKIQIVTDKFSKLVCK